MQTRNAFRKLTTAITMAPLRARLGYLGRDADIHTGAHFEYPGNIALGTGACVARHAILRANSHVAPGIFIGDNTHVGEYSLVAANRGIVDVGNNSWVGPHCVILGNGGVRIGNNVMIASHCAISTVAHNHDRLDIPMNEQGVQCDPIVIGNDVWIGTGAVILKGVRVGAGSIIAAGAVVTRDIPAGSIAMGVPARVTDQRLPENVTHLMTRSERAAMGSPSCQ